MANDSQSLKKKNSEDKSRKRTNHRKGAHLTFAERSIIQSMLENQCSFREIARTIGCAVNTVINEYKRGNVSDGNAGGRQQFQGEALVVCNKHEERDILRPIQARGHCLH